MDKIVVGFLVKDTALRQARHLWRAVPGIALAILGLVASHGCANAESEAVLAQAESAQPAVSPPVQKPSGATEGCPYGTYKPLFKAGCAKPSTDSKLPTKDSEPMRFEAVQLSKSIFFLQGTGTITKETPAEFARFLATDGANASTNLSLHSPGGDEIAGMELGRAIRKARLNTTIERSIPLEGLMKVYRYKDPACTSACAWAFLGGVSRFYSADALYGLHRNASIAGAPLYLEEMGIDPRLLQAASSAATKGDVFVVPTILGKEWRVIFDASGLTTFNVEERRGQTTAVFDFANRGHKYGGMLYCEQGRSVMAILDRDDAVHPVLRIMNAFPAEFEANGRKIAGNATYVGRTEQSPAAILFLLPLLDAQSFSGSGLVLTRLTNPQLMPSSTSPGGGDLANRGLLDALSWGDAESALLFRIAADNGAHVLPSVFKDCHLQNKSSSDAGLPR